MPAILLSQLYNESFIFKKVATPAGYYLFVKALDMRLRIAETSQAAKN